MTSQNLKLITTYTQAMKGYIHLSEYKNDFEEIKNSSYVSIVGAGKISIMDIDKSDKHQIRSGDLDIGNTKGIKEQISLRGLSKIPYVIWDEILQMFIIVSGHHRIQALIEIERDKGVAEEDILIPVCVLEFSNDDEKDFFLQRENTKHEQSKGHSKKDAILFLQSLLAKNYNNWQKIISNDTTKFKKEVYKALKDAGYPYETSGKSDVYEKAFEKQLKIDVIKTHTPSSATTVAINRYGVKKVGAWQQQNKFVIASSEDASTKVLKQAVRLRLKWVEKNNRIGLAPKGEVKMITYFAKAASYESLQDKRATLLTTLQRENKFLYNNPNLNFTVDEVSYLPQFKSGDGKFVESQQIRFFWDYNTMTFRCPNGVNFRQALSVKPKTNKSKKTIQSKKNKNGINNYFMRQKDLYEKIINLVGMNPRSFPTRAVFFTRPEAEAIAKHINPSFDFKGKTVCGHEKSIFANSIPGWEKQDTTATHPSMPNLEKILSNLSS